MRAVPVSAGVGWRSCCAFCGLLSWLLPFVSPCLDAVGEWARKEPTAVIQLGHSLVKVLRPLWPVAFSTRVPFCSLTC